MKCSPEFRKRVAEQAELARRKTGRGYTGQLFFTYGEVKWLLADLQRLYDIEEAEKPLTREDAARLTQVLEAVKITPIDTPLTDMANSEFWQNHPPI